MKRQFSCRPILAGAITLTVCLLVVALLMTTRSVGATLRLTSVDTPPAPGPRSPAAVDETLLPKSTAAYNGIITPAHTVYAPWLVGRTSLLHIHNTGDSEATVRAIFSYGDGEIAVQETQLKAGAVGNISPPSEVLTGTEMSAILTGTQPIVAVVNDFGTDRKRATSYAAIPDGVGQTYLALPHIVFDNRGWDSKAVVQNVGVMTASVTITYTNPNNLQSWHDSQELAPKQVYAFDPLDAGVPPLFEGIASVGSEQPLIAIVNSSESLYPNGTYIYRVPVPPAEGGGNRPLYFPALVNNFETWIESVIRFVNAGPITATFDLEIDGVAALTDESIEPWKTGGYYSQNDRPSDWSGGGLVPDAQSIHGLTWLLGNFTGDFYAAYSALSRGAKTWYLPYADEGALFTTYVAVQNLGGGQAHITRTYHTVAGALSPIVEEDAIQLSDVAHYSAPYAAFVGGVVIQADQPVSAVAVIAGRLILNEKVYMPVIMRDY